MIVSGTGSVKGGTGWYLMVLGQQRAVLIDTGSVMGGTD